MTSILWLNEIGLKDRFQIGNKAASLAALHQEGLAVPNGFCITSEAFQNTSEAFWLEIERAYEILAQNHEVVAVRSSGVAEDSPEASFAGQFETILNVHNTATLKDAIQRCWQSVYSPRVQTYRIRHERQKDALAVLVQLQIPAEVSGVLYTFDPISGSDQFAIIEATQGVGDRLLAGHVKPDMYLVDKQGRVSSRSNENLLTPEQCRVLAELGSQVERLLGYGQDLEWAIHEDQIYVLQARPITGYRSIVPLSQVWTRANVGEVLPNPVTPLTWDVFRATLLDKPSLLKNLASQTEDGSEGIRRIDGRVYLRVGNLLSSFCYLPKVTPEVVFQVLGGNLAALNHTFNKPSGPLFRVAQTAFLMDALRLFPYLSCVNGRIQDQDLAEPKSIEQLITWTARCFRIHLRCTAYAIGAFGLLSYLLGRWAPAQAIGLLPEILIGRENLQTAAQGTSLWKLAEEVQGNEALCKAVSSHTDWSGVVKNLQDVEGGTSFLKKMADFLNKNGARSAEEFELAVPRWREDPSFVLSVLQKYFVSLRKGSQHGLDERRRHQQKTVDHLKLSLSPLKRWIFMRLLSSYSGYSTLRENMKYRLIEGYGQLRQMFLEIGSGLVKRGILEKREDVFFLRAPEVLSSLAHPDQIENRNDLIRLRREQHALWKSQVTRDIVVDEVRGGMDGVAAQLAGIGCSPGLVEGFARVLFDPSEAAFLEPGEILVAPHTDPGWTPLFLTCKAIVTEIGGFLSHGATVAREYGIPAVLNVKEATLRIKTGDFLRVDGTNGLVTICKGSKARGA